MMSSFSCQVESSCSHPKVPCCVSDTRVLSPHSSCPLCVWSLLVFTLTHWGWWYLYPLVDSQTEAVTKDLRKVEALALASGKLELSTILARALAISALTLFDCLLTGTGVSPSSPVFLPVFFGWLLETGSSCIAQPGLQLSILSLSLPNAGITRASKIARWVKVLATTPDNLSSTLGTYLPSRTRGLPHPHCAEHMCAWHKHIIQSHKYT